MNLSWASFSSLSFSVKFSFSFVFMLLLLLGLSSFSFLIFLLPLNLVLPLSELPLVSNILSSSLSLLILLILFSSSFFGSSSFSFSSSFFSSSGINISLVLVSLFILISLSLLLFPKFLAIFKINPPILFLTLLSSLIVLFLLKSFDTDEFCLISVIPSPVPNLVKFHLSTKCLAISVTTGPISLQWTSCQGILVSLSLTALSFK